MVMCIQLDVPKTLYETCCSIMVSWYIKREREREKKPKSWVEHILGKIAKDGSWNVGI